MDVETRGIAGPLPHHLVCVWRRLPHLTLPYKVTASLERRVEALAKQLRDAEAAKAAARPRSAHHESVH